MIDLKKLRELNFRLTKKDLKENTGETEYFFERNGVITVRNREVYMERIIDYGIKSVVGHLIGVEIKYKRRAVNVAFRNRYPEAKVRLITVDNFY